MRAHQVARIHQRPDLPSQIGARLPQPCRVNAQPLPRNNPVETNVQCPANSFPSRMRLLQPSRRVGLQVRNIEKIKVDALLCQRCPFAAPIPEEMLPRRQPKQRVLVLRLARILRPGRPNKDQYPQKRQPSASRRPAQPNPAPKKTVRRYVVILNFIKGGKITTRRITGASHRAPKGAPATSTAHSRPCLG